MPESMIVVLAGGVGAARFLQGLVQVVPPAEVAVIVNTADDVELHGLHVSPDVDSVLYHLAGLADEARGWGIRDETFGALELLGRYGMDTWFQLGARDLATHRVPNPADDRIPRADLRPDAAGLAALPGVFREAPRCRRGARRAVSRDRS